VPAQDAAQRQGSNSSTSQDSVKFSAVGSHAGSSYEVAAGVCRLAAAAATRVVLLLLKQPLFQPFHQLLVQQECCCS
jgi:hypothetical protein